jgi:hypothetical protein
LLAEIDDVVANVFIAGIGHPAFHEELSSSKRGFSLSARSVAPSDTEREALVRRLRSANHAKGPRSQPDRFICSQAERKARRDEQQH